MTAEASDDTPITEGARAMIYEPNHETESPELPADDLDEEAGTLGIPAGERRLVTQPYDLGVRSIVDDIDGGRITLGNHYQRGYVWDNAKASRLIESLLLNVPIPVVYFAEDDEGRYEAIDGLQRLTSIKRFLSDEFRLTGLPVLSELEGKRFAELDAREQRKIENRTIRCIVISADSHPDIKFDVFERLNTGAVSLRAQELRNAVYRGAFNDSLRDCIQEPAFVAIMGTNASNKRMELDELVLRFLALTANLPGYKPPLRQFLNTFMRDRREKPMTDAERAAFAETCAAVRDLGGTTPFKVDGASNAFNKALFDALMVPVFFANRQTLRANNVDLADVKRRALEDSDFVTAVGRATADRQRMFKRISIIAQLLRDEGVQVDLPSLETTTG